MTQQHISGVAIRGVSCAVPSNVVQGGHDTRTAKTVGVYERRFARNGNDDLIDLAHAAATRLLDDLEWVAPPDALIFVTQTSPRRMPSISCELHERLKLPNCVPAFDLNMACSGYTYGLWVAASLRVKRCLLVVGDTISHFLDPDDSTYSIFGDAVSATALELCGENRQITFVGGTDGGGAEALRIDNALRMDGQAVFDFAVSRVPQLVKDTTLGAYCDFHLFHQANKLMVEHIAKKAGLDMERVPFNMDRYGNTSSASIPLLMCDSAATETLREKKCRISMFGFGAGLSWGGILTETDRLSLSLVEV